MFYRINLVLFYIITEHQMLSAPTFTSWPEVVTSYRGQSATLTWTLSEVVTKNWDSIILYYDKSKPVAVCTWYSFNPNKVYYAEDYKDGKVKADIKIGTKTVSYTLYNLEFDDVRYNYKCEVKITPTQTVSNMKAWILLYEIPSSPVINRSPSNAVVNRAITLTCSARSTSILPNNLPTDLHPTMEYRWQRDKSNISNDGRHRVNGNVLTIDKVWRQDHHITYRCIAQETGSNLSNYKDLTLNVMYGPYDIKATPSGNITQTENDSLTLTCAATCNPNCSYKWTKDGQQISNSDKLYLGNIKRQDQGTYRCLASNGIGTDQETDVYVEVYYAPQLHVTVTPSGDLIQGSEVTLICTVDSRPDPSFITWSNITLSDMTVFDNSKNNTNDCWLTLSDINILHSGTYQCRADNGVRGSPVSINQTIIVYGPPRWYELDPVDKVIGASVGDRVNFKVWVIAQPLPRQDEWQWKFSPTNSSNIINTKPGQVDLTVSGDMAVLSITNITINHYGNYYILTKNEYGGWNEEDLSFSLKPQGPPLKPDNFHVTDVTAVSIRVEWITGFNAGLPQTFTIRYTNVATGVVKIKSDIEDIGAGSGQIMTDDITDGIEPGTEYKLEIFAVNSQGQTAGDIQSAVTPAMAHFKEKPQVTITGDQATIHFIIFGQLTHIKVENCVRGIEKCVTKHVVISDEERREQQTPKLIHDFTAKVSLADSEGKQFVFSFWIYDGDVILQTEPTTVEIDVTKVPYKIIIGSLVGIILAVFIITFITVLWRKGFLLKKICKEEQGRDRVSQSSGAVGQENPVITCEDEVNPYITSEDIRSVAVHKGSSSSSNDALPTEIGPLNGDIYSQVNKKTKAGRGRKSSNPHVPVVYCEVNKPRKSPKFVISGKDNGKPGCARQNQIQKEPGNFPYVNVSHTEKKDCIYSEVQIPHFNVKDSNDTDRGTQAKKETHSKQNTKQFQLLGEDGIMYADLEIINKPPDDPEMIHGKENLIDYARIDYNVLKKNKAD